MLHSEIIVGRRCEMAGYGTFSHPCSVLIYDTADCLGRGYLLCFFLCPEFYVTLGLGSGNKCLIALVVQY